MPKSPQAASPDASRNACPTWFMIPKNRRRVIFMTGTSPASAYSTFFLFRWKQKWADAGSLCEFEEVAKLARVGYARPAVRATFAWVPLALLALLPRGARA